MSTPNEDLDERKAAILRAIVEEFVDTAQPVGSQTIAGSRDLGVSSATIRNEMTVLEHQGYITQPHTSAGRVPTDRGYRYFVDHLSQAGRLGPMQQRAVTDFFARATRALEDVLHETSQLLADITQHAAVVVGPQPDVATVRSVQLVSLHANVLLALAVLSNGAVEKATVLLDHDAEDARIDAATALLTGHLAGATMASLPVVPMSGDAETDRLVAAARIALTELTAGGGHEPVFVGGASRIAAEQEAFSAPETVSRLLALFEHHFLVVTLVGNLIDKGMSVRIGAENELVELRECSIVTSPFLVEGEVAGTVAVLGPTRMKYPQTMAAVAAVSRRLGRHLSS